jgi:hypothetical protein
MRFIGLGVTIPELATRGGELFAGTVAALDFGNGIYKGTTGFVPAISALPGYAYTRAGAKQERIGSTFSSYVTNQPAIIHNSGYFSRASVTNKILASQALDGYSNGGSVTVTPNAIAAPDGSVTAELVVPTTATTIHGLSDSIAMGAGTFTFSVFAKAAGYPRIGMRVFDGAAYQIFTCLDVSAGTIVSGGASATITSVGNGWFYCTGTGTSVTGSMGSSTGWDIDVMDSGHTTNQSFAANGTSGVYLWQTQVVQSSPPDVPIIVTGGSAATVGADSLSITVPSGTYSAVYTFDDNSTQIVSTTVAANLWTLPVYPTVLNRPLVKKVTLA